MSRSAPASFREAAVALLPGVVLREETDADLDFLHAVYASARAEEMARAPWSDEEKRDFLAQQFALQRLHYRKHYPGAEFLVVEGEAPAGRIYVHRGSSEVRLMDIALLTAARGAGLGTRLTRALLDWADELALPVTLHVEPFNPAYRMYRRAGFAYVRSVGINHFLEREPHAAAVDGALSMSAWPRVS